MSSTAHIPPDIVAGIAEGCERLVAPHVAPADRGVHARFIAVMLFAPFVAAAAWPAIFGASFADGIALALAGAAFAISWAAVAIVSATGRLARVASLALALSAAVLAMLVAAVGGFASPALLCVLALVAESLWVMRSRPALVAGAAAAGAVLLAQPLLAGLFDTTPGFAAWQWLLPAAYAAIAMPRLAAALGAARPAVEAPARNLEELLDLVTIRMSPDGEVLTASDQSARLIGVQPSLLTGDGFFERIHLGDRITYLSALADVREGRDRASLELRLRVLQDGDISYPLFSAEIFAGDPVTLALRRLAEVELLKRELAAAREETAKVEIASSRFLANVSHELRTPLNAIVGFSDMLAHEMAGPFTDQRQRDYSGLIRDAGCHLLDVVNSILDASKIEAGAYPIRPESVRFGDIAASSHAMLALLADRKRLTFSNEVGDAAGELICDRRAVQQVLINLLSNAIKFTPEGGSVSLSARRFGRRLVIDVADSGIGIADRDLERLGRPFEQIENDYTRRCEGTGLGLSIASALVKLHDGTLSIASSPGDGTIVTVTLPVDGPRNMPAAKMTTDTEGRSDVAFRKSA